MENQMTITCKPYSPADRDVITGIWNEIVDAGNAFPQEAPFTVEEADVFFQQQTATVCAWDHEKILGFYILHDNNVGRCSHTANASYGVAGHARGQGVGKVLVTDSLQRAKACGYLGLQYNAVVKTNYTAITLYLKLGFSVIGTVPDGYRLRDGSYQDLLIFHKKLT